MSTSSTLNAAPINNNVVLSVNYNNKSVQSSLTEAPIEQNKNLCANNASKEPITIGSTALTNDEDQNSILLSATIDVPTNNNDDI